MMENVLLLQTMLIACFLLTWAFVLFAIYFIPVIIAFIRRHNNILAISILTIFLGWSFFGWLGALLWSLNSDVAPKEDIDD